MSNQNGFDSDEQEAYERKKWEEAITNIFDRLLNRGFEPNDEDVAEAKSALTQLIKDLIVDAKPEPYEKGETHPYTEGFNYAIAQFEQNLLKLLEER